MELNELREAAIVNMAAALDLPEELLAALPPLTPEERAEMEAAHLREIEEIMQGLAASMSDRIVSSLGLDPERYRVVFDLEEDSR